MKTIELKINKGCDRSKVFLTLKMLRDGELLISLHQTYNNSIYTLVATYIVWNVC